MSPLAGCLSLLCLSLGSTAQRTPDWGRLPQSPCPAVFSYGWGAAGGWHGVVTILPPARFSEVQLVLKMTVPYYRPEAGVGQVEVKGGTPELQAISRSAYRGERRPYQYLVVFPPAGEYEVPRMKTITINGKTFCEDNREYADTRSNIDLTYNLKTGLTLPLAPGSDYSVVGGAPSQPASQSNPTSGYQQSNQQPNQQVYQQSNQQPNQQVYQQPNQQSNQQPNQQVYQKPNQHPYQEHTTSRPQPRPRPRPRPTTTPPPEYEEYEDTPTEEELDEFHVDGLNCGVPKLRHNNLILGGTTAERGQWPWQAAMYTSSSKKLEFRCGGTLVSRRHVISAGHCVYSSARRKVMATNSILVHLGRHDLNSWTETEALINNVDKIILHPKYTRTTQNYDISVLILSSSVKFSEFILPVCLWDRSPSLGSILATPGTVVGWGRDENGDIANELKTAKMPVVSQETCLRSGDFYSVFTSNVTFCAGYRNGTSVCNGDSGGGMFFYLDNPKQNVKTWYTRGVVSVSQRKESDSDLVCDDRNYVVFTDLAKMLPWLRRQLSPP